MIDILVDGYKAEVLRQYDDDEITELDCMKKLLVGKIILESSNRVSDGEYLANAAKILEVIMPEEYEEEEEMDEDE